MADKIMADSEIKLRFAKREMMGKAMQMNENSKRQSI